MLLTSPRHTAADLAAWQKLEAWDARIAETGHLDRPTERARQVIREFAAAGPCYASTSWGKDSTVLVDLIGSTGVDIPVVSLRIDGYDLPGTDQVRDLTLTRWPHLRYDELTLPPQPNRWWDTGQGAQSKWQSDLGWRMIADRYGPRRLTGIRAEESRIRSMVQARWGDASTGAARPIGRWTAVDVFAYLHQHNLPVHPAYACSHGGHLDRRWLRVHALGGVTGADRGRADWEQAYYGDIIVGARRRDAAMTLMPRSKHDAVAPVALAAGMPVHTPLQGMVPLLHTMEDQGLCQVSSRHGQDRWYRIVDWPPRPHWMLPEPVREEVTLL